MAFEKDLRKDVVGSKTIQDAVQKLTDHLAGSKQIELDDAWQAYTESPVALDSGSDHLKNKQSHINDFVAFVEAECPYAHTLAQITHRITDQYFTHLRSKGRYAYNAKSAPKERRELSHRTINIMIGNLRQLFDALAERASVASNPFGHIKRLKENSVKREMLTQEEFEKLLTNANPFLKPLIVLALYAGVRRKDICLLKSNAIDLTDKTIKLKMAKTGKIVYFPMMLPLYEFLTNIDLSGTYAFPDLANEYKHHRSNLDWRLRELYKRAGIATTKEANGKHRRRSNTKGLHALRHTFASIAALNGVPITVVKDLLGHSSEMVTEIYASHVSMADKRKAMDKMAEHFNNSGVSTKDQLCEMVDRLDAKNVGKIKPKILELLRQL